MSAFLVFLGFVALFAFAGVYTIRNNRPATTDRNWSVGAMLDR